MILKIWLFFSVSLLASGYGASPSSGGCTWNLNTQLPVNDPIYLTATGGKVQLAIPENSDGLHLERNEPLLLFCPGKNNAISQADSNEATIRCDQNQNVNLGSKKVDLKELKCKKKTVGDALITDTPCGDGGHIIKLGYNTTLGWVDLIKACYDDKKGTALYSEHTLIGAAMGGSSKQSLRPAFNSAGIPKEIHPAQTYTQSSQVKILSKILNQEAAKKMIAGNSYMARGHLAPDADFLYGSWQYTTFFYVNAVPQWQQVNAGNWKRLEALVRKISEKLGHNVKAYTGSHGMFSLASSSGDVPLYLANDDRLPVPKWTWKIIQSEKTKEAIAFASLNDPFAQSIVSADVLCKNICRTSNWHHEDWDNFAKGYTICCKVEDLAKRLGNIPKISSSGILKGPL